MPQTLKKRDVFTILQKAFEKDNEIKDMLQKNEIKYKTYNHENVNEIS